MDKIKHLRIYVHVYQEGNFSKAATKLGLSPSTISKSISTLEDKIGLRLIERSTRSLTFTRLGVEYACTAMEVLQKLEDIEYMLRYSSSSASGSMKLHVPVSYGRLYILPMLPRFKERYPDIKLNITFSDEYVDMIRDGYDLCIRSGYIGDCSLVANKLSPVDLITCASPQYLESNGSFLREGLGSHTWIKFRHKHNGKIAPVYVPTDGAGEGDGKFEELVTDSDIVVDDGEAMLELCAKGAGLAQVPHYVARKWLDDGRVVSLGTVIRPRQQGVYVIYPGRRNLPERSRLFIAFLKNYLASIGEYPERTWAEDTVNGA